MSLFKARNKPSITDPPALTIGDTTVVAASRQDDDAIKEMETYRRSELTRLRSHAEKWTAGLATLTGVLGTALVVKGPDSFDGLSSARILGVEVPISGVVAFLLLAGATLLFRSVYLAYRAANGSPLRSALTDRASQSGGLVSDASTRWRSAIATSAEQSRQDLRAATRYTISAAIVLALATATTWLAPRDQIGDSLCLQDSTGGTVIRVTQVPSVLKGELTIVRCPSLKPEPQD